MKKKFMLRAFSLMEMMIVLLIVAIIAAASAPMISKKMMRQTGTGDSPWVFTGTGNSIAYNMKGDNNTSVAIGLQGVNFNDNNNNNVYFHNRVTRVDGAPLLLRTISNNNNPSPAIALADDDNRIMGYLGMTRGTTYFSNVIPTDNGGNDDGGTIIGSLLELFENGVMNTVRNKVIVGYDIQYRNNGTNPDRSFDVIYGSNMRNILSIAPNDNNASANIIIGSDINGAGGFSRTVVLGDNLNYNNPIFDSVLMGSRVQSNGGQGIVAAGAQAVANGNGATAIGFQAQAQDQNTVAVGNGATASNQNAIAVGNTATASNTSTIAIGSNSVSTAGNSVAIGAFANAIGSSSVALGNRASAQQNGAIAIGSIVQDGELLTSATNSDSIAIGHSAQAMGVNAIAIGSNARAGALNSVAIGAGAQSNVQNQIVLGTSNNIVRIPGTLRVSTIQDLSGNPIYLPVSDIRLKNVGEKLTSGLEDIKKLEFFNYTFKDDKEQKPHVGVMAQDLQKVFPISVTEGSDGYLRIRWDEMFYAALNAIKELDNKITEIKTKVASYFDRVAKLEAQIDEQQKTIEELQKQNAEFKKRLAKIEKRGVNKRVGVNRAVQTIKTPSKQAESEAE